MGSNGNILYPVAGSSVGSWRPPIWSAPQTPRLTFQDIQTYVIISYDDLQAVCVLDVVECNAYESIDYARMYQQQYDYAHITAHPIEKIRGRNIVDTQFHKGETA